MMSDVELLEPDLDSRYFTEEEYLDYELGHELRHEYFDGVIRAMGGASDQHEGVSMQLAFLLMMHLKGKPCRVYKSDMKLRIQSRKQAGKLVYYYPDIMVVCDPIDTAANYKSRPKLVIEVLSQDKGKDLIEKLAIYREIETLEEYVVVGQSASHPEVYVFRRRADFEPAIMHEGEFTLESLGLTLSIPDLYKF
jgi:Uma2 family endonuclease